MKSYCRVTNAEIESLWYRMETGVFGKTDIAWQRGTSVWLGRQLDTANLPTNIVDFRGFDSSIILKFRGGISRPMGNFPESLSQAMWVGIVLVGRLGARLRRTPARVVHAHGDTCFINCGIHEHVISIVGSISVSTEKRSGLWSLACGVEQSTERRILCHHRTFRRTWTFGTCVGGGFKGGGFNK